MSEHEYLLTEDDPLREELVAYLDGELDADAIASVERRLSEDSNCRLALARLQQSWDMLDCLPASSPSAEFTKSTLELAVHTAEDEAASRTSRARGVRQTVISLAVAGVLVVVAFGYIWTTRMLNADNRRLERDLPVIQNVNYYRHIDDVEFLRQLEQSGLFAEEEVADESP